MKTCKGCEYLSKQKKVHLHICRNPKSECFNRLSPHSRIPKACRFYKDKSEPFIGSYIDYDKIEDMKFVESLRGKYSDSDFWIIGTDPNLDLYPDNFFDDKLSMTLNFACIGFPNSTYFCLTSTPPVPKTIVNKFGSDYLGKCIFGAPAQRLRNRHTVWENWGLDPIFAKASKKSIAEQDDEDKERMIGQLINEGSFELIGGKGIINFAIQIVALFGAKKIILVGCSNKGGDFYYHAQKRGMSEFYRDKEWKPSLLKMYRENRAPPQRSKKQETMMLVKLFRKHNIEIVRHRFDERKDGFIFEEIKLDE